MNPSPGWKRLFLLLEIPAPDPPRLLRRIEVMERNVMLPVRAFAVGIIYYSFISTSWLDRSPARWT